MEWRHGGDSPDGNEVGVRRGGESRGKTPHFFSPSCVTKGEKPEHGHGLLHPDELSVLRTCARSEGVRDG